MARPVSEICAATASYTRARERPHERPLDGTASEVEWSSDFQPAGLPENEATKAIQDVYRQVVDNLRKMFGG